jgi:hypothetical protein
VCCYDTAAMMTRISCTALGLLLLCACQSTHASAHGQSEQAAPPAQAATYVCPMHPEVTDDKPGQCPKCGMKLEPKKE